MDREGPGTPGTFDAPASHHQNHAFPTTASERLQLAFDAGAIIGTWVWDIPGNRVTADVRFSRSFGLAADRCLTGIPIEEAFSSIHPDDRDRVSTDIQDAMPRGGSYRCEYRVRQHDGYYRWVEANGRAELNSEGLAVRFPGVLMPAGQPIFRVRIVDPDIQLTRSSELGPPPAAYANMPNRMSPVGIPMFYGAFDQETAVRETYDPADKTLKKAATGEFSPIRDLRIVDLSRSFFVPSLFDPELQTLRPYFRFMRDFIEDFTKPIERSDRAHAEYVPTQVVTEYFRHVYRTHDDHQIDGIIYPSSKTGAKAIVIFADASGCIDAEDPPNDRTLLRFDRAYDVALSAFDAVGDYDEIF